MRDSRKLSRRSARIVEMSKLNFFRVFGKGDSGFENVLASPNSTSKFAGNVPKKHDIAITNIEYKMLCTFI